MYGRYTKDLGEYAKEEARRLKYHEKARRKYDKTRAEELRKSRRGPLCRKLLALLAFAWKHTGARLGEDWVFLALLGIIMALISYAMDRGISMCNNGQSLRESSGKSRRLIRDTLDVAAFGHVAMIASHIRYTNKF